MKMFLFFSAAETPPMIKLEDVIDVVYAIEKLSSVACPTTRLKFLQNIHSEATVTTSVIHFRVITRRGRECE